MALQLGYDPEAGDPRHFGRANLFTVTIDRVPDVEIAVVSTSGLLGYQVGVLTVNYGHEPAKMAEKPELGEISLVLHDNVGHATAEAIWAWFRQVYDPELRRVGIPSEYKSDGELIVYTTKGERVRSFALQGLWPSAVEFSDYSYENAELTTITVTLQVDRVLLR